MERRLSKELREVPGEPGADFGASTVGEAQAWIQWSEGGDTEEGAHVRRVAAASDDGPAGRTLLGSGSDRRVPGDEAYDRAAEFRRGRPLVSSAPPGAGGGLLAPGPAGTRPPRRRGGGGEDAEIYWQDAELHPSSQRAAHPAAWRTDSQESSSRLSSSSAWNDDGPEPAAWRQFGTDLGPLQISPEGTSEEAEWGDGPEPPRERFLPEGLNRALTEHVIRQP